MSDRLREILANGRCSANYNQYGENFVRVDFKCPNEANDFFRALMLITVPTLDDNPTLSGKQRLEQAPRPIPAAEFRAAFAPERQPDDELLDELTNEFRAGFAEDYRKKTVPVKPEPEWRPMETAPEDGTVIEILFQAKPFKDAIHRCLYTNVGITGGEFYQCDNYAKGWRPIDEQ